MLYSELDIIPGLEEAYFSIFQLNQTWDYGVLGSRICPASRYRSPQLALRSLFVKWQDLYNSFDQARKNRWTSYWIQFGAGTHRGAGGWPGSGYSAFVWVNAPRYRAGLPLILDPQYINLLQNGSFSDGSVGWDFEHIIFGSSYAKFNPLSGAHFLATLEPSSYLFNVFWGHSYRVVFDYSLALGGEVGGIFFENSDPDDYTVSIPSGSGTVDYTVVAINTEYAGFICFNDGSDLFSGLEISNIRIYDLGIIP
jgi:hypothetical protein